MGLVSPVTMMGITHSFSETGQWFIFREIYSSETVFFQGISLCVGGSYMVQDGDDDDDFYVML